MNSITDGSRPAAASAPALHHPHPDAQASPDPASTQEAPQRPAEPPADQPAPDLGPAGQAGPQGLHAMLARLRQIAHAVAWLPSRPHDPARGDEDLPAAQGPTARPSAPAPHQSAPVSDRHLPEPTASPAPSRTDTIPPALRNRYLISDDNKYYFRDRGQALAFEDLGHRLRTSHNDADVARSMVELAQSKGWSHLKLRGTNAFKQEAWLAAMEQGLQVSGYRATERDKARLADRLAAHEQDRKAQAINNTIDHAGSDRGPSTSRTDQGKQADASADARKQPGKQIDAHQLRAIEQLKKFLRQRGDSDAAIDMTVKLATDELAHHRTHFGKLLEHGSARYQFDPTNDVNYFVTLEIPGGRQTIWGVDLERAIKDSGAALGEGIVLTHHGSRAVTTTTPERDGAGQPTGRRERIGADRNTWEVISLDNAKEFATRASGGEDGQSKAPTPRAVTRPKEIRERIGQEPTRAR